MAKTLIIPMTFLLILFIYPHIVIAQESESAMVEAENEEIMVMVGDAEDMNLDEEESLWPDLKFHGQFAANFKLQEDEKADTQGSSYFRLQMGVDAWVAEQTNLSLILRVEQSTNENDVATTIKFIKAMFETSIYDVVSLRLGRLLSKYTTSEYFGRFAIGNKWREFYFLFDVFYNDAAEIETTLDFPVNLVVGMQYHLKPMYFASLYGVVKLKYYFTDEMGINGNFTYAYLHRDLEKVPSEVLDYHRFEFDVNFDYGGFLVPYINYGFDIRAFDVVNEIHLTPTNQLGAGIHFYPYKLTSILSFFKKVAFEFDIQGLEEPWKDIEDRTGLYLRLGFEYQAVYFDYGVYINLTDQSSIFHQRLINYFRLTVRY